MSSIFSLKGRANQHEWYVNEVMARAAGLVIFALWLFAIEATEVPPREEEVSAFTEIWTFFWYTHPILKLLLSGSIVFLIAYYWIGFANQVKRLHDRGKSGYWMIFYLIPVIGSIWWYIESRFLPGTPGPNQYDSKLENFNPASYQFDRHMQEKSNASQDIKDQQPIRKSKRNKSPKKRKRLFGS